MNNKIILDEELANFLEMIRNNKYADSSIIGYLHSGDICWDEDLVKLRELIIKNKVELNDLMRAMVEGYRVKPKETKRTEILKAVKRLCGYEVVPDILADEIEKIAKRNDIDW